MTKDEIKDILSNLLVLYSKVGKEYKSLVNKIRKYMDMLSFEECLEVFHNVGYNYC